MAIVNMTALKMSLISHSSKHQHGDCRVFFQVEIVGEVRRTVQLMGGMERYTQKDGLTSILISIISINGSVYPSVSLSVHPSPP